MALPYTHGMGGEWRVKEDERKRRDRKERDKEDDRRERKKEMGETYLRWYGICLLTRSCIRHLIII